MEKSLRSIVQPEFFGWLPGPKFLRWIAILLVLGLGVLSVKYVLPYMNESQPALTDADEARIFAICSNTLREGPERFTWGVKAISKYCNCLAYRAGRHLSRRHVRLAEERPPDEALRSLQPILGAVRAECASYVLPRPIVRDAALDPGNGRLG